MKPDRKKNKVDQESQTLYISPRTRIWTAKFGTGPGADKTGPEVGQTHKNRLTLAIFPHNETGQKNGTEGVLFNFTLLRHQSPIPDRAIGSVQFAASDDSGPGQKVKPLSLSGPGFFEKSRVPGNFPSWKNIYLLSQRLAALTYIYR